MNILVIAPHPDDEALGCGGVIGLHQNRGDRVAAVFLTSGELGLKHMTREEAWQVREQEADSAAELLGIALTRFLRQPDWYLGDHVSETAALLRAVLEREHPGVIYLPHAHEWHPDHQAALPILQAALGEDARWTPTVWAYEVWTPLQQYDRAEDITSTMSRKLRAIRCHRSQQEGFRYDRALRGLNQYRGALTIGCRFAEVFEAISLRPPG